MAENDPFSLTNSPPSLKQKLKNYSCFSCCFPHSRNTPTSSSDENPGLIWVNPEESNNLKDKILRALNFVGNRHKRRSSTEFRYDPLSYSLNFEDGFDDKEEENAHFSSRLPPSPPVKVKPMSGREVTAAS